LGRRRGPVGDVRCIIGGSVSMIKVYSTHLWKCHTETHKNISKRTLERQTTFML
jgi:hypothetical protein